MGRQNNTANNGSVYAVTGGGNINFGGAPAVAPESDPKKAVEPIRVLMLAANPSSTARLAIDEEARDITERLRLSHGRDEFELITRWAVRAMDLLPYLNEHSPHIVHFSGHGDGGGGIVLSAADGTGHRVSAAGLAELFRVTNDRISVVVLNACHSAAQVREIGRYVDYVVGMRAPITDDAAMVFAVSFYTALGFGRPIPQAFEQAAALMAVQDPASRGIAELVARPNANPYLYHAREGAR